jgi:hypothetical protein
MLSDYVLPITRMIPDTTTCSGQGKTHDECAVLCEGFASHVLLGCMGIECNSRILEECDMSPNVHTGLSLEEQLHCALVPTHDSVIFVVS